MARRFSDGERDTAKKIFDAVSDMNLGGGLWLRFARSGNKPNMVWRYTAPSGRRREMGLGPLDRMSVSQVAERLAKVQLEVAGYRDLLNKAKDPLEERDAERARARQALQVEASAKQKDATTLARFARAYHEKFIEPQRSKKHGGEWIACLENHLGRTEHAQQMGYDVRLWNVPIASISESDLHDFFCDIKTRLPETGSRIVQRLGVIFAHAKFRKLRADNPAAAAREELKTTFKQKRMRGNFAALDYREVPSFVQKLRQQEGIAARCFEFAMLTAARTGEVIGATWDEIAFEAGTWTVPATRMKGGQKNGDHVVHLVPRAKEILEQMKELGQKCLFPSVRLDGKALSNMAMLQVLKRMKLEKVTTVHGLCRASFSTWANETAAARSDVVEACLAHREASLVRRAYNRAQFMNERAKLLQAWSDFIDGMQPADNVVQLRAA